jgi:energy-coupling factor transporter ATP-binding protein EcfA2
MSKPAIEISGLVKAFGDFRALDGLDLEVATGEVHGFLGPNGAGKTTTVRILTTILKPDRGHASPGVNYMAKTLFLHRSDGARDVKNDDHPEDFRGPPVQRLVPPARPCMHAFRPVPEWDRAASRRATAAPPCTSSNPGFAAPCSMPCP